MFAIIISEKGGAERRENFDKSEINVGRVHGNDLVLPKGNVSKHHTRLLFRDGRFIVTDLKSTNGTYVNGRKIAQATIVREGDKIYIGDFVLRVETEGGAGAAAAEASSAAPAEDAGAAAPRDNMPPRPLNNPPAVTLKAPTHPPPAVAARSGAPSVPLSGAGPLSAEHPLDDSASLPRVPSAPPSVAPPPAVGSRPMTMPLTPLGGGQRPAPPGSLQPPLVPPLPPPSKMALPAVSAEPSAAAPEAAPLSIPRTATPPRVSAKEASVLAARRLALTMLVGRIADAIDLSSLRTSPLVPDAFAQQIERVSRDQARGMRDEGEAPADVDLDVLARSAHREFVGLGAIEPLLDDEEVTEIHCVRYDQIFSVRKGTTVHEGLAFSSDEALRRVIARLAEQSGEGWRSGETIIERRTSRAAIVAIAPPSASTHALSVRKRRRVDVTLEDLVRQSALSRPMAQFLEACVVAHVNILVAGAVTSGVLSALASAGAVGERACVLHDLEEIGITGAHVVNLSITEGGGEECVRAVSRLNPQRLVVAHLTGAVAAATVDAVSDGREGVLAAINAPTLRHGFSRLVGQLARLRPGLGFESWREVVGDSFDLALEVTSLPDGRIRVTKIAEVGGTDTKGIVLRDLFVFNAESGGDGAFSATGVVPRIANDLAQRGTKLDPTLFKRTGRA